MQLTCIVVEDEPLALEKLKDFISRVPFLQLSGSFENALGALHFLNTNAVDIIFLDIQMEQLTGIQMLETMTSKPYVIITSAYAEYALKGYELQVFDYLLKPYSFERFLAAVNNVFDDLHKQRHAEGKALQLFVKTEYRIESISISDILYIEGMQAYLRIVLPDKKIMTKQSFSGLLAALPCDQFIRVHKSWVVNLSRVESVERNRIKIGDRLIPIGETYRDAFHRRIGLI